MVEHLVSTVDNPYNPHHQFEDWNAWDIRMGYHTWAFLARLIVTSPDLSRSDEDQAIEDAVEEIVRENILGIYIKVGPDDQVPRVTTLPPLD